MWNLPWEGYIDATAANVRDKVSLALPRFLVEVETLVVQKFVATAPRDYSGYHGGSSGRGKELL